MDRNAILLNLRDVRDLEFTRIYMERKYDEEIEDFQSRINSLSTVGYMETVKNEKRGSKMGVISLIGLIIGGFMIEEEHNAAENARMEQNQPEIAKLQKKLQECEDYWITSCNKVDLLLGEAYAVNIIPGDYRSPAAIAYIYDYMRTSNISLEQIFSLAKIEEGIRKTEARLDEIIEQNHKMICLQHKQEAQNKQIIRQNEQMLTSLWQVEGNALEAARYAKLNASYNQTNAFFATADHWNRKLAGQR